MGTKTREEPHRLAAKLRQIRLALGLTQEEMRRSLRYGTSTALQRHISEFERGLRTPSLLTLLRYARLAGVLMEDLVDDELDLPAKLPARRSNPARRNLADESPHGD